MKRLSSLAITAFSGVSALFGQIAMAATQAQAGTGQITTVQGLIDFMCNIVGYFFYFVLALSSVMIIYAAFTYVTAGDDTEKTSKARRIITYAAVGVAVALLATTFPRIVDSFFTTPSGIGAQC